MKVVYNVYYGQWPFNKQLGQVEAEEDKPEDALQLAIQQFKGKVPEGHTRDSENRYENHPVIARSIISQH
jgi:hypothetical protein